MTTEPWQEAPSRGLCSNCPCKISPLCAGFGPGLAALGVPDVRFGGSSGGDTVVCRWLV